MRPTRADLIAGVSVAFVLVPQSLAHAEIAGLPAYFGLYAATLPPIAAAFLASSRYLQTGPVALTSLLAFGALSELATPSSVEYIELAVLLALVVGVGRLMLGWLKAGNVAYLMSEPMLVGFMTAAAILIIASQVPTLLGAAPDKGGLLPRAWDAVASPGEWHWVGIGLAAMTVTLFVVGRRIHRLFPGILLALIVGLLFSELTDFTGLVVGRVPSGLPPLNFGFPWGSVPDLLIPGFVIALVGFAEPAAIARTLAASDRERWNPNREFASQGIANVASAFVSGFPVGGSFSRSALAKLAGGRTRWTGAIAGLAVLLFVPFASVLDSLPRPVLAAVVITAIAHLVQVPKMIRLIRISWGQSTVAWGTFAATLALAPRVDLAVIIGIVLATGFHLRREMRVQVDCEYAAGTLVLKPAGVLYFGSAPRLDQTLVDQLAAHPDTTDVVVSLERLGRIDFTGALALRTFTEDANAVGLDVALIGVPDHAMGTLTRSWGEALNAVIGD